MRLTPFTIAGLYALLGGLWIVFSDRIVAALVADPAALTRVQTYKGWFYVAATAVVLFHLVRRHGFAIRESEDASRTSARRAEEEKLKSEAIVAAIGDGISVQDTDFKIVYQNEIHKKLIGDQTGEYCYRVYERAEERCRGCPVALSFEDGKIHTVERSASTDRGLIHVEITASPLRDATGKIIAGIEVVRDITERKRAEEALRQASDHLNAILKASPATIMTLDVDGIVTLWNPAAERVFGWSREEAVGRFNPMVPEDRIEEFYELRDRVLRGESLSGVEVRRKRKDGSPVDISLFTAPLRDAKGAIVGIMGICSDITKQKENEAMLRESERKFHRLYQEFVTLLDAIPDALSLLDSDLRIVWANRSTSGRLEKRIEDIQREHCYSLWHGRSEPCERCPVQRSFQSGDPEVETIQSRDGRVIDLRAFPLKDEDGRVINVIQVSRDITEHRKLEEQLRQAQRMEAVGRLAGGIAHDFNNILTAVIGYTNLIQMKIRENDPLRVYLDQILASSERAKNLTQGLLAFSRKQIINPRPVDINEIIGKVEKLLTRVIGEDVELSISLSASPLMVMADIGQMEQVILNLCTNARDAMPEGGLLTIETRLVSIGDAFINERGYGREGTYALVSVSDTGLGIDEKTRERIFEPFFTTKEVGKGTGLGLSMAYGIIKQHEGYIDVTSEVGKGTAVSVYLPITEHGAEEGKPPQPGVPEKGTETILIAEDDTIVRTLIRSVLEKYGYQVVDAVNGEDAVEKFIENREGIGLAILDVIMPKKNGKEVYAEIKKFRPDMKVLFISGYTADIVHRKGILEKELHFISKPVSPQELLKKVRQVLDIS